MLEALLSQLTRRKAAEPDAGAEEPLAIGRRPLASGRRLPVRAGFAWTHFGVAHFFDNTHPGL